MSLSTPEEIDALLRWPLGKAERLARRGRLPHIVLPDKTTVRFDRAEVEALVTRVPAAPTGDQKRDTELAGQ